MSITIFVTLWIIIPVQCYHCGLCSPAAQLMYHERRLFVNLFVQSFFPSLYSAKTLYCYSISYTCYPIPFEPCSNTQTNVLIFPMLRPTTDTGTHTVPLLIIYPIGRVPGGIFAGTVPACPKSAYAGSHKKPRFFKGCFPWLKWFHLYYIRGWGSKSEKIYFW